MNKFSCLYLLCFTACGHSNARLPVVSGHQVGPTEIAESPSRKDVKEGRQSTVRAAEEKAHAQHLKSNTVSHNGTLEADKAALRKRANDALKKIHKDAQRN